MPTSPSTDSVNEPAPLLRALRAALASVLRGKPEVIEKVLVAILAGGHVLLEDVPGVGKTTLAKAIARALGVRFTRVQFTPDLLPADITGSLVLNPEKGTFAFHKGPLFTNVLLADEINRASPRTQAALLEAMNEAQVTVDGETHPLVQPFLVLATQNPADYQGTYPLPEAQLDRFMVRLSIGYPDLDEELAMLYARRTSDPLDDVAMVCTQNELMDLQSKTRAVEMKPLVGRYLLRIVDATRKDADLELGVSPRGSIAFFRAAQAHAFIAGRAYVSPEDLQATAESTLSHRVQMKSELRYAGKTGAQVITRIVRGVSVPT